MQEGLCDGIFKGLGYNILNGAKSCRCSKLYRWTGKQRVYQLDKLDSFKNGDYTFVKWDGMSKSKQRKATIRCAKHGLFTSIVDNLLNLHGCPACAVNGFRRDINGSLYVLKIRNDESGESFCGYGISNYIEDRLASHRRILRRHGFVIDEVFTATSTGGVVHDIELSIKAKFVSANKNIKGFKKESTLIENYEEVVDYVRREISSRATR